MLTLPRILKPLDDNDALIARVSGEPSPTIACRLLDEERCLGTNVRNDLKSFGLAPHEWSDRLVEFYAQTNAFLYETAARNPAVAADWRLVALHWPPRCDESDALPDRETDVSARSPVGAGP